MKILAIGATGIIGNTVANALEAEHEVIRASRSSQTHSIDIESPKSIRAFFLRPERYDAIVCTAGHTYWGPLLGSDDSAMLMGINSKLLGQINLVRLGIPALNPQGSFTLTTGILGDRPVPGSINATLVNGALNAFVKAMAIELGGRARINTVAVGLVEDSEKKLGAFFPGHTPIRMDQVVNAYSKAIFGTMSGETIREY